jgi:hypothetical protein
VGDGEIELLPEAGAISALFALFFVGYCGWDIFEFRRALTEKARRFYWKVIAWEVVSFLGFIAFTPVAVKYRDSELATAMLAVALTFTALWFFNLVREKRLADA